MQYVNNNGQAVNYNDKKIYSYLRFSENQKLLFICNFDLEKSYSTNIFIPQGAWNLMKIDTKVPVSYTNVFSFDRESNSQTINQQTKAISFLEALSINLAPNSVTVFEIK